MVWTIGLEGSGLTQDKRAPIMIKMVKNPGNRRSVSFNPSPSPWTNKRKEGTEWRTKMEAVAEIKIANRIQRKKKAAK